MTGFARVMELEAEDREVRRIERESLRACIKHMLQHPENMWK